MERRSNADILNFLNAKIKAKNALKNFGVLRLRQCSHSAHHFVVNPISEY
jgi:hypothetical protein